MGFLRLYLALAVVIAHSGPIGRFHGIGGLIAVQSFYIISGFYMAMILNTKYVGRGSYQLFITNRLFRLLPVYWVVLSLTFAANRHGYAAPGFVWQETSWKDSLGPVAAAFLLTSNLLVFGQDWVLFSAVNHARFHLTANFLDSNPRLFTFLLVPQAWTLGIEMTFYAVAPFLVRRRLRIILALIALSIGLRLFLALALGLDSDPWSYRFFPSEIALFLAGSVSFRLFQYLKDLQPDNVSLSFAASSFLALTIGFEFLPTWAQQRWIYYLGACLTIPALFLWSGKWKIDRYLGELSYPVYICHLFVLAVVGKRVPELTTTCLAYKGVVGAAGSILLSICFLHLVINPMEAFRQRRVKNSHPIHHRPSVAEVPAIKTTRILGLILAALRRKNPQ